MRRYRFGTTLLATTFIFAHSAQTVFAQTASAPAAGGSTPGQPPQRTSTAPSPPSETAFPDAASSPEAEQINVTAGISSANGVTGTTPGGGLMPLQTAAKIQSGLTRDFIAKQSPTTDPLAMVAELPGVVEGNNDPLGTNDQVTGLTVRGLSQNEIGFVYEGIPAADPLNFIMFTSTTADNENIHDLTLSQGSPDVEAPLYNAVGAQLTETLRDPARHAGGEIDLAYGSYALNREFIRLDTGLIGNTGARSFVSFSYQDADNWRGPGDSKRYHVDSKTVKEWGDNNRAAFVVSFNSPIGTYYRTPTLAQYKVDGTNFNYSDNPKDGSLYYKLDQNRRDSLILGAPQHYTLTSNLSLAVTPYFTWDHGYGDGGTSLGTKTSFYGNQPAGPLLVGNGSASVVAASIGTFNEHNSGLNTALSWQKGSNTASVGYWYSYFTQQEHSYYAGEDAGGGISSLTGDFPILTTLGPYLQSYNINLVQQTNSVFVKDVYRALNDRLTLTADFKEVLLSRMSTELVPGADYKIGASFEEPLPQVSASYMITPKDQLFVDASTAFRAPASITTLADEFSTTTGVISHQHATDEQAEYSIGEEIGFRHHGLVNVSAGLFNYNFTHRQLSTEGYVNGAPVTLAINAGGQTARGAEVELSLRPWHHLSPYISGQYLHTSIDNNLQVGTDYLPTKGKTAVNSPTYTAAAGLTYDDGSVFGLLTLNYVSSQYSTFMNDEQIPGFETFNASVGYRFPSIGPAKHPQIQLNLINIGNDGYLSGAYGITTNAKATRGVFGTTIAASAPTYYIGGGFAGVVSLTTAF